MDIISADEVNLSEKLSKEESARLRSCEARIKKGLATFVEVGQALATIKDERLYRREYSTFEAYCKNKWEFGRAHAYRYIKGALVVQNLSPAGDKLPENEWQIRPLLKLPEEKLQEAWEKIVEASGDEPITSSKVVAVAQEFLEASGNGKPKGRPKQAKTSDWLRVKEAMDEALAAARDEASHDEIVEKLEALNEAIALVQPQS